MSESDYVTVKPSVGYQRFNVVVMHYDSTMDEFVVHRISQPLPRPAADALARSWAAATGLDVR